jgi:predicted anti-sigma-YlaC factor YlaD
MKISWPILVAAIVGFVLGAMLFRTAPVHAIGAVHITAVETPDGSPTLSTIEGNVVAISCIRNWSGPGGICYVVSQ